MAKKITAFKFSQAMRDALDELVHPDRLLRLANSRTGWLEVSLSWFIKDLLKGKISQRQLDVCQTPDDIFELFVMYSRAKRGEAGYRLVKGKSITHHEKDEDEKMKQFREKPLEVWVMKMPEGK